MGNASYRPGNANVPDHRSHFQIDLPKFIIQKRIGNGKFMKTYLVKVDGVEGVPLVVKVYMKLPEEDLQTVAMELSNLWKTISPSRYPNLLPYQMWIKSSQRGKVTPVYLIRQFVHANLHDRLSTRPFLTDVEKRWLMYQLFKALEVCHLSHGIIHGDIKPENVLCTSWNWLVLTDFGTFKPANLPDDDPTDFQFYFDTMGRSSCYIAPERFFRRAVKSQDPNNKNAQFENLPPPTQLTSAIDVFSLGCTMAEIFLDGETFIDLPGMLQYVGAGGAKRGGATGGRSSSPTPLERLDQEESPARGMINRISNSLVRDVIVDMTQLRPERRTNVRNYRHILEGRRKIDTILTQGGNPPSVTNNGSSSSGAKKTTAPKELPFPEYFAQTVYPLFNKLHTKGVTPDDRIVILCENYADIIQGVTGKSDMVGTDFFKAAVKSIGGNNSDSQNATAPLTTAASPLSNGSPQNKMREVTQVPAPETITPFARPEVVNSARVRPGQQNGPRVLSTRIFTSVSDSAATRNHGNNRASDGINALVDAAAEGSANSGHAWGENETMQLAIDELMEKCYELIKIAESEQHPTTLPLKPSPIGTGTNASSNRNINSPGAQSHKKLSGAALMEAALHSSYGVDSILHAVNNPAVQTSSAATSFLDLTQLTGRPADRIIHDGLLLPIQVVVACFRGLKYPHTKIASLLLLIRLGAHCADDVILHRIVPTLLHAAEDLMAQVRATAIRCLRSILTVVQKVNAVESNIFPQYLFPALNGIIVKESELLVRVAFAESIGRFAETAKRFLDQAHLAVMKSRSKGEGDDEERAGNVQFVNFSYDKLLKTLHDQVNRWIKDLLQDSNSRMNNTRIAPILAKQPSIRGKGVMDGSSSRDQPGSTLRRVLLVDVVRLCAFYGHESMDLLLQHLLTFLNDPDWEVRYAFCAKIPSVCAFSGPVITSERVLPCLETALMDAEERVTARVVQSLGTLLRLGLLSTRCVISDVFKMITPLVLHPCDSIRKATIDLCVAAFEAIGPVDTMVFLFPLLKPLQQFDILGCELNESILSLALQPPISRTSYRTALREKVKLFPGIIPFESLSITDPSTTNEAPTISARVGQLAASVQLKTDIGGPTQGVDVLDAPRLSVMSRYLDGVAREINNKAVYFNRSTSIATYNTSSVSMQDSTTDGFSYLPETGLQSASTLIAHCPIECLLVPHQKHGSMLFPTFASEQVRRLVIANPATIRNVNKLRAYYGIQTQETAKRVIGLGYADMMEQEMANDPSSRTLSPATTARKSTYMSGTRTSHNNGADAPEGYNFEMRTTIKRIRALNITPLPPDVGMLVQPEERRYNDLPDIPDQASRQTWRPRENTLVACLQEHSLAVNQLAVSPDHAFFASASSDQTVRVWRIRGIDRLAVPRSAYSYRRHQGAVTSAVVLENSHTVASGSEDGSVHVWRLDHIADGGNIAAERGDDGHRFTNTASTDIKHLAPSEGSVISVNHFNGDLTSVVVYLTQYGGLHGWDLRAAKEAFHYAVRPELGQPSSLALSTDRTWLTVGTSRGYISLWDIRFNVMNKLWRHSSQGAIHRLATCKSLRRVTGTMQQAAYSTRSEHLIGPAEGAYLFVAAGNNEAAVWAVPEGGQCLKCFRSVPLRSCRQPIAPLPLLNEVQLPRHPHAPIVAAFESNESFSSTYDPSEHSYRAVLGRISEKGTSYLVTAGTDRVIRYWDFSSPYKCFTVCGLLPSQPRPTYETPQVDDLWGKLYLSYDAAVPSPETTAQSQLPVREGRGPLQPSTNFKDAILDLKSIDVPSRLMLSASRDGDIKLWR